MIQDKVNFKNLLISLGILVLLVSLSTSTGIIQAADNGVKVEKGWTPIPGGEANSENDITMKNSNFAVTISGTEGSKPPWGVPRGGILDGAPVVDGEIQLDRLILVDFLPDRWSGWPTDYQDVKIVENSPKKGVVEVKRDWYEAELITTITLEKGDEFVHLESTLKNAKEVHEDINSGYTLSIEGGWIDVPGGRGARENTLGDWMVGYNENWAFGLHSNYYSTVDGGTTWIEQFKTNTFNPEDEKTYEAWLQVVPKGESSPVIDFNMELNDTARGKVSGKVINTQGQKLEKLIVVAYKNGEVFGWNIGKDGKYSFDLPTGTYQLKAMAEKNAPSSSKKVTVKENEEKTVNLTDVKGPGNINLGVSENNTEKPLDAKIEISGGPEYPIRYLGSTTKFTNLDNKGKASFAFPPATYDMTINSGAPFVAEETTLEDITVKSGETNNLSATINITKQPNDHNWYSADLHQHSDILDGITTPKELVISNLAAQTDLAFVSDHDSVARHRAVKEFANQRNLPFIPSVEISPMWSHFNVFPLPMGYEKLHSTGTASEIFETARELEDVVIQINHPWISYGYYNAQNNDSIPGGYDNDYDVVEIRKQKIKNSDKKTINKLYNLWNQGKEKYMVGNTDIHDIESNTTGYIRTFANVEGDLTAETFSAAVKEGNSFVSRGPLVYPEKDFGQTYQLENGVFELSFEAAAAKGLKEVHVVKEGEKIKSRLLSSQYVDLEEVEEKEYEFYLPTSEDTWYSLIIVDKAGNHLYTNPIWVEAN